MGCSFCTKNNIIINDNDISIINVQDILIKNIDTESNSLSKEQLFISKINNSIENQNNCQSVTILKSDNNNPQIINEEKPNYFANKIIKYIKGFLFRKKYEDYLKTQLMDHTNELYFQFIFLTKNFNSSKILNNKEDEYLQTILKTGWEKFYSKDPTLIIKNKINKTKKYSNGLIFKYNNKNFDSNDIDQCLKNVESCYKGSVELLTNKKCGLGELTNINGTQEIGTFYNDEFYGWNLFIKNNGIIYIGLFNNDLLNGHGICFNYENKKLYKGLFKDFQKEGYGEENFEGNKYRGEFKEDKKCGKGEIIFKNNDIYKGEFADDLINGYGKYIWKNNNKVYEGNFLNGKINGNGILKWDGGRYYKGVFNNGIKEGKGEFGHLNKKKYYFDFKNDLPFGEGYYINKSNKKCIVNYNHGIIVDLYGNEFIFFFD